jgi:hypothetical protein
MKSWKDTKVLKVEGVSEPKQYRFLHNAYDKLRYVEAGLSSLS